MTLKPASAKAKGSRLERRVASALGGKRTPLSGAAGGGDITLPDGSIWNDWMWEAKQRKRMDWTTARLALDQAEIGARGGNRRPAAVLCEDRGEPVFMARLSDVIAWAEALVEIGNGYTAKRIIRAIKGQLGELEGVL